MMNSIVNIVNVSNLLDGNIDGATNNMVEIGDKIFLLSPYNYTNYNIYTVKKVNKSKNRQLLNPDLIIYHKNCPDGTAAAWSVKKLGGGKCKSLPTPAGTDVDINEILTRKSIWYVDISPSYNFIIKLNDEISKITLENQPKITIIDHHETFNSTIKKLVSNNKLFNLKWLTIYYDNKRSGCQLTFDYINLYTDYNNMFNKTELNDIITTSNNLICVNEIIKDNDVKLLFDSRPWFINYIGERDLWCFDSLLNCKAINTSLYANCSGLYTYKYFDTLNIYKNNELIEYMKKITDQGLKIIEENDKIINKFSNSAKHMKYIDTNNTYNIWLIEVDQSGYQLRSEIGNFCTTKQFNDKTLPDFVVCALFTPENNIWRFACRGADKVNLSVFCAKFGGGGHPNASGFELPSNKHYNTIFNDIN